MLILEDIRAGYGGVPALHGVSLEVGAGEAVALMGPNGMGKSTTIGAVCGLVAATGRLTFGGRDLLALPSHARARLGLGLVPEGRRTFGPLTVRENLAAAARPGPWSEARIADLFPRLAERAGQRADTLSGGEQQMLAIGRALATNPTLLLLDEATEGLAPLIRAEIRAAITRARQEGGLSVLIVDKSVAELREVADRAVILDRGRSVWAGGFDGLDAEMASRLFGAPPA
jgi:branched-chain amino acid transport system ATP-binding protein